jgi:hypothetical protein
VTYSRQEIAENLVSIQTHYPDSENQYMWQMQKKFTKPNSQKYLQG